LSGNDAVRVFYLEPAGSLTLDTLSVQHGNAGSGQGGGIYNAGGSLVVTGCTVADNRASHGGAIFNYGNSTLVVSSSTLSGNQAASYGGGIANYENSRLKITNSTLSGNSAGWGGGIDNSSSTITMTNSTLSGNRAANGGGIHNYNGTVSLTATILDTGDTGVNCYGGITDSGYSLSDDGSCSLSGTGSRNNADLYLDPLADNGGPTLTHLPGAGSAAIDLIPNGALLSDNGLSTTCNQNGEPLDSDQRGEPRPAGGPQPVATSDACDAGAVEAGDLPVVLMLISPANGSTIGHSMPAFDWVDLPGATHYQIQVDDQADFSSPVLGMIVTASAYTLAATLPPGTYYWSVRAGSGNTWGTYTEPWKVTLVAPPGVPVLEFPPNGSITSAASLSFVWGLVDGATRYQIQVDDNTDFSSPAIDSIVSTSAYSHEMLLPDGTYTWRVRSGNSVWGAYSGGWGLICSRVPAVPGLLSPADKSTLPGSTPTFDWNDVPGAVQYQIQVDDSADFSSPLVSTVVTASVYAPASPWPAGIYYWRVRAGSPVLWGDTSPAWMLIVNTVGNLERP
jgi:hypothetical protein